MLSYKLPHLHHPFRWYSCGDMGAMQSSKTKKGRCLSIWNIAFILGLVIITNTVAIFTTVVWMKKWEFSNVSKTVNKRERYYTRVLGNQSGASNSDIKTFYYKLSKTKITNYNYSYVIKGDQICDDDIPPFLLVLVHSSDDHRERRKAIRKTWGSISKTKQWPKVRTSLPQVKVVFLFGITNSSEGQKKLHDESDQYRDIVQADFVDSYYNLTRKSVIGMKWVSEYCSSVKYILKADDDVFVHIPNLIRLLENETEEKRGMVYGHTQVDTNVLRTGRWAVSEETFPFSKYPAYTCGATYVLTGHIATEIYRISEYMSYLNMEDVFVTGVVRKMIGAGITEVSGFTAAYEEKPRPCTFHNDAKMSATNLGPSLAYNIWSKLDESLQNCYFIPHYKETLVD